MWDRFRIDKKLDIDRKYINIGVVAVITGIALFIGYEIVSRSGTFINIIKNAILGFLSVIRPIIIGAIISYLLFPLVRRIEIFIKKCVSVKGNNKFNWIYRIISIVLVFFIIILSVVLIFNFIIPPLLENAKSLINNIPQYESVVRNGINNLNSYFATLDINYQQISTYIDKVTAAFAVIGQEIVNIITNSIYGFGSFMIDFVLSI
ncbi:MAG TPA: hypothetical protein DCR69_14115, partial [Clostridium sp.]|nr:hypothetical protein [Clostridium sp.]